MHGGGVGDSAGEKRDWGWDQRMECGVHSPGGTAVYFDLPGQLLHIPYLGDKSRLHLPHCC